MLQPFPKFYIVRPDGSLTPLIPVDELPKWVSFANWDPEDVSMYSYMYAASLTSIPREGEYDLVCHHCFAQVDGHHRSVSEQSDMGIRVPTPALPYGDIISKSDSCSIQAPAPAPTQVTTVPILQTFLKQPPFHANLYSPFVGMCLVNFPRLRWPFKFGSTDQDQDRNQDQDHTDEDREEDEERSDRRSHHSNHSASDADIDSDSDEPARAPLLQAIDIPKPTPNPSHGSSPDIDLELGLGLKTSGPPRQHYLDGANVFTSEYWQPSEEPSSKDVNRKKSALGHKASSSRQGTKRVRFDSFGTNSTGIKAI